MSSHHPDEQQGLDLLRRAAIYVRMSTNPQEYSIQHQIDRLNQYAQEHQIDIVMVYADAGKSGLRISGREGLQRLIGDVQSGAAEFEVVLVYDVSRWGRFQDIDESAHYEFMCRQAGVQVVYCAEHFVDDGTPVYALMKGVKRIMAAEYSRELGEKVHHAQCRFSQLGFKQGGRPGYGLRRVPISQSGEVKAPLLQGERKSVMTDRVTLAHSSPAEVEVVRRIYRLYTEDELNDSEIARILQTEGHSTQMGRPWDNCTVRRILMNPRYCGEVVYNQTTRRLKGKVHANPEQDWIHCADALDPMVERDTFDLARQIRKRRAAGPDREVVLDQLREVFRQKGTINAKLCNAFGLPRRNTILKLFGSYIGAYAAAGLPTQFTAGGALGFRSMHATIDTLVGKAIVCAESAGAKAARTEVWNVLRIDDAVLVKISVASCRRCEDGCRRWRIPLTCGAKADYVICALMNDTNVDIETFLLLSTASDTKSSLLLSRRKLSGYVESAFKSMDEIFGLARTLSQDNA